MAKQKKEEYQIDSVLQENESVKLPIEDMPLESLRDYRLYNEEARKMNKKLRICRYPIKPCPVELHPKVRIKFSNNDKSINEIPVFVSNHLIHFDQKLTPGKEYDLPEYIASYLANKGYPVWGWVNLPDGSKETRVLNKQPRFSVTNVWKEE